MAREVERGDGGAVLGFPDGRYTELRAGVRRSMAALSRDIYSREEVHRRLYELQVTVRHGNSGGPFVLPGRRAAGLVVGTSLANDRLGYAITSPQLLPLVDRAARRSSEVGTGRCVR
jgi:hypothetical protein